MKAGCEFIHDIVSLIGVKGYGIIICMSLPALSTLGQSLRTLQSAAMFLVHIFFAHKIWMREFTPTGNASTYLTIVPKVTRKRYWWLPMTIVGI